MEQRFINILKECLLFRDMSMNELSALLDCLNFNMRRFRKGEFANIAGDPFDGVGVLLSGQAAVVKENPLGDRMILSILKPGDLFGEIAAFSGSGKWPASVVAQTECSMIYVPTDKLVGQCAHSCLGHRKLIINMLWILSGKAMALSRKLEYLSIRSMRGRIASFLLEQAKKTGQNTFYLPMNRNELSDFLNVARPSLSREMSRMKEEGIIDYHRSSIRIMDMKALKAAAE